MNEQITLKDLYNFMNDTRKELNASILRLENKFDMLEAGRLSSLEGNLQSIKAQIDPIKKIVYGLVAAILIAVIGALLKLII